MEGSKDRRFSVAVACPATPNPEVAKVHGTSCGSAASAQGLENARALRALTGVFTR